MSHSGQYKDADSSDRGLALECSASGVPTKAVEWPQLSALVLVTD